MKELRVAGIISDSIVDGPGVRYVIFTQGCAHKCPGCHNPQTHDYKGGTLVSFAEILADVESYKYIKGITFSGGEPLDQPEALKDFIQGFKDKGYHILVFSGYTFEQIMANSEKAQAIKRADILIDGKFDLNLRALSLKFRGSSNQRIIDLQKSFLSGETVIIED